jgi:hypothetical protein
MHRIVPDVESLEQHLALLYNDPERYRPAACVACGLARPWAHGAYTRKSDRAAERNRGLTTFLCDKPQPSAVGTSSVGECRGVDETARAALRPERWAPTKSSARRLTESFSGSILSQVW